MTKDSVQRVAAAIFSRLKGAFAPLDHTHPTATSSDNGLMSSADKRTLDDLVKVVIDPPEVDIMDFGTAYPYNVYEDNDGIHIKTSYALPPHGHNYGAGLKIIDGTTLTLTDCDGLPIGQAVTIPSRIWTGTQAEYDALATKSSTTLYFITE